MTAHHAKDGRNQSQQEEKAEPHQRRMGHTKEHRPKGEGRRGRERSTTQKEEGRPPLDFTLQNVTLLDFD